MQPFKVRLHPGKKKDDDAIAVKVGKESVSMVRQVRQVNICTGERKSRQSKGVWARMKREAERQRDGEESLYTAERVVVNGSRSR